MAYEVLWTDHAAKDVDRIISYIAIDLGSPKAATEHLHEFEAVVEMLAETPEIHAVSKVSALSRRNLRTCFVKSYVMVYSFDGSQCIIHRVFHMRQDYARLLDE